MNLRPLGVALALAALLGSGVAATPVAAQIQPAPVLRSERGSARNLIHVRRRLEALIDQMQRDQHDYGGYRVQAIQALQQARQDIMQAIQSDATPPG